MLVGSGIGQGKGSFRAERSHNDPFVYRGRLDIGVAGTTVRTRVTLQLVNERKLQGELRATFEERGVRCTITRRVVLDYVGGG